MTAAERLVSLAGTTGTAAVLLLLIGSGPTAGDALVNYSQLPNGTAAEHILVDRQEVSQTAPAVGSSNRNKRKPLVIVEIDGVEFRVPYDKLDSFIAAQKKIIKADNRRVTQKAKRNGRELPKQQLPSVVIIDAPKEYLPLIKAQIDNRSEIYYKLWQSSILEYIRRMDDEEIMVLIAKEYENIALILS